MAYVFVAGCSGRQVKMKIIIRQHDVRNTSNISNLNKPFLVDRDEVIELDNAEIVIQTTDENGLHRGLTFDADGILVFNEVLSFSKDGSKLSRGFTIDGSISTKSGDLKTLIIEQALKND